MTLAAAPARPLAAQAGVVSGTIVDAASAAPLPDAAVTLEPREGGALSAPPRGGGGVLRATWAARTDSAGRYRFAGVAGGEYRLRVQRIGYRPQEVEITLRGAAESQVSVGLVAQPVALEPLEARALPPEAAANPYGRRAGEEAGDGTARVEAERLRQRTFLAPDVRVLTGADVQEGVTLAETDLFRALQRLPGISARDDYSADLWTRGAPWDHTRVYFDGIPLYNPVHTFGIFSGINADAVGAVFFHPGAQPASTGGGAAATLDVRSRRGGEAGRTAGTAELSMTSVRASLDGTAGGGRHQWMVAARSSYPGWMSSRIERRAHDRDSWVTSLYADLAARHDARLTETAALETSALLQWDVVENGPDTDWDDSARPRWGNLALRSTLRFPAGGARASVTAGVSRFSARVRGPESTPGHAGALFSWPSLFASSSRVGYAVAEGRLEPGDAPPEGPRWSAGAGVARHATDYSGAPPFPLDNRLPATAITREGTVSYGFLWGEGRWSPVPALLVQGGMRVEAGSSLPGAGALRWAPRVSARLRAGPLVWISAGAGRTLQYVQAGPELGEQSITQHLWLAAGDAPALRSDVATLGAEAWLGGSWLGSVTAYERRSTGMAVMDPRPGPVFGRPVFVEGSLRAEGIEAGLRKLTGRWTFSGAYSWGVSTTTAAGLSFPSRADQRHSLDLSGRMRVGRGLHVGAALAVSTGAAYNRFFGGIARCTPQDRQCEWEEMPRLDPPGTLRAPAYASLDLLADWSHAFGRLRLGTFLQVHNVLGRSNPARYNHSVHYPRCGFGTPNPDGSGCTDDIWSTGLPRLPVLGMRASF